MHAFLTTTLSPTKDVLEKINITSHLVFTVKKLSEVYDLQSFLKFPPSEPTLIILNGVDEASLEAQNALLKTLEEPSGKFISFLLCVQNIESLLPTILSRVQIIKGIEGIDHKTEINFSKLPKKDQIETLFSLKERSDAVQFLNFLCKNTQETTSFREAAVEALGPLSKNANVTLVLLNFFTSIASLDS